MIILIAIAIVLVLGILFGVIYRILTLTDIAQKRQVGEQDIDISNNVNALLFGLLFFIGFGAFGWYSITTTDMYILPVASEHGVRTDGLFWFTMAIITTALVLVHIVLFFSPLMFRYQKNRRAHWFPHDNKMELIWTIIPAIVLAGLVVRGWFIWDDITQPAPKERVEVEVMGRQFSWQVRYGGKDGEIGRYDFRKIDAINSMGMDFKNDPKNLDDFTPREIHIPKGKPVLLKIRARDVLHSVFLPHFRVKMDAVPGMPTSFWFTPTKTTKEMRQETGNEKFNYELACTEICGSGHFAMRMIVVVDEPEDYKKWYAEQTPWVEMNADYMKETYPDLKLANN